MLAIILFFFITAQTHRHRRHTIIISSSFIKRFFSERKAHYTVQLTNTRAKSANLKQ